MAFLAVGQLHVELFKTPLCRHLAFLQLVKLDVNFSHVGLNLPAACAGLLGQLRQAQHFNLQLVDTA